jgi:hypothetical protein
MADLQKRLSGPSYLTTSAVTQYTVPAATSCILRSIHVVNLHSSAPLNFTMSIGADAGNTRLFHTYALTPLQVLDWSGFIVLNAGEIIQAYGSTTNLLVMTMSGVEVS